MRIQFKASEIIKKYHNPGLGIILEDGQTADLSEDVATGLVNDFPQNFFFMENKPKREEVETPVIDRAIKTSRSRKRTVKKS